MYGPPNFFNSQTSPCTSKGKCFFITCTAWRCASFLAQEWISSVGCYNNINTVRNDDTVEILLFLFFFPFSLGHAIS